ncbi:sensor histidine kinase [Legionella rubrilucens]|uniref:histidine kinase n=1 Tax=Legionella rubrilucens TaxID=458 RepID=A0A0W0XXH0_9GAMM|nr:ATP-binding protein [Legionella rubrilucens]KTD49106.1 sensor histidine kinase [Legionella rubrilucens]
MSIRYKILLSMLMVALLFIPLNIYLLKRYVDVNQHFLTIVDKTVPRLEALLTMKNLTTRIDLFIKNFNIKFNQATINSNTPSKIGSVKDEFLALLEELGEQQNTYKKYQIETTRTNVKKLNRLRDDVILAALDVFSVKEQNKPPKELAIKAKHLADKEHELNEFIKILLLQESTFLEEERQGINSASLELRNLIIILNTAIILIILFLSFFLTKVISKPIIHLSQFANNIDYDNLKPLLPILSNDEIGDLQNHLNNMLQKLNKAKATLIETSRSAGVAEIATSILHNVGNVLNSINTSVALLSENIQLSYVSQLPKLLDVIEDNKNNLDYYINHDERGKLVIPYFKKLIGQLTDEKVKSQEELETLNKNLTHVNQIIAMQQSASRPGSQILERIDIDDLIEEILLLYASRLRKININVERQFNQTPPFVSVKNKIQQILINLIKNAVDSLAISTQKLKRLIIKIELMEEKNRLLICVSDNGSGISKEHLQKIFSFGFTTKQEGHGYGLHNCALLAKELGGQLQADSVGLDQGATFTLILPFEAENVS